MINPCFIFVSVDRYLFGILSTILLQDCLFKLIIVLYIIFSLREVVSIKNYNYWLRILVSSIKHYSNKILAPHREHYFIEMFFLYSKFSTLIDTFNIVSRVFGEKLQIRKLSLLIIFGLHTMFCTCYWKKYDRYNCLSPAGKSIWTNIYVCCSHNNLTPFILNWKF